MITIKMNQLHSGKTKWMPVPDAHGIEADVALDGSVVNYRFHGRNWTQPRALRWLKNRKLNQVEYREHDNGTVFFNQLRLKGSVALGKVNAREILGPKYDNLAKIEQEHGGGEPFLVEVIAMNFKGKKTVVGNRLRFHRDGVNAMIEQFAGLPIHLGHTGFFGDEKTRIGNTVASHVGEDGNPHVFAYFNPHGEGREFRESMRVAAAQNLLGTFAFSMVGKPTDVEVINRSDDAEVHSDMKLADDGAYAIVREFEPKFMDAVNDPALEGSTSVAIINSKNESVSVDDLLTTKNRSEIMDKPITLSQALMVLGSEDRLMLTDLLKIDSLKEAFDDFSKQAVEAKVTELKADDKFKLSLVETIDAEALLECPAVQSAIELHNTKVEQCRADVAEIAKTNEIELSGPHEYLVLSGINTVMSEQEILSKIKETVKLSDLSGVPDFFLKSETKTEESDGLVGVTFEKASGEQAAQAEPTISL
jgi:hypothetical protein